MSVNLEPQTTAKCIIYTSKGNLNVELWAKECPIASKLFIETCLSKFWVGSSLGEFGEDGSKLYIDFDGDTKFKDSIAMESNSRLLFNREGLLGWDIDAGLWFVTTSEKCDGKRKILIGKIVDQTIYNFREICNGEKSKKNSNKFLYPADITDIEVTIPYFKDLEGNTTPVASNFNSSAKKVQKSLKRAVKLKMDYTEEDYEDEDDDGSISLPVPKKMKIKLPKSIVIDQTKESTIEITPAKDNSETPQEVPKTYQDNPDDEETRTSNDGGQLLIDTDTKSERELETLKLFEQFRNKIKGKKILNRGNKNPGI
ncbi:hypothetical protein Kpol_457p6 [Vanderwaltozyma polyspora DSM 70294]|uniref:PPIase cyclophilin-type domain-containing protein n=1 Tax=Vanderwaltozyma polyspora (strain ATCC 22028 / DSM 70294 / BCRC 21397 / CBS 2163 / NBRC 10782 / NRRL Y-8283 / UCD 57-17) TaxID=436907 RepID=A7TQU7_VANPO|nr:uncharacterized protein Kpol_457p6 [Vanderwaltozyma polyspora DSM 70294]EDO15355.1 hypothetical protein Kpol_457p6 [Vanderwaltozyma polyspora DSM 70294]